MSEFRFYELEETSGEAKEILTGVKGAYGFVPNLFAYMIEAPATVKTYLQQNELLRSTSFDDGQLQLCLLAVSIENDCNFCSVAHQAMAGMTKVLPQSVSAVVNGEEIADASDRALVETILMVMREKGWTSEAARQKFYDAGFSQKQYFELMMIISIKTLSNYINHVTKPEPNAELLAMIAK
jgi:AhpD family alkylhydroperoxidase